MDYNTNHDNNIIDAVETNQNTFTSQRKARKEHPLAKKVGVSVLCGTFFGAAAGGAFAGTSYMIGANQSSTSSVNSSTAQSLAALTTTNTNSSYKPTNTITEPSNTLSVADIASTCMPSIVAITNIGVKDVMTFWGNMQQPSESCGSGVIIGKTDSELLIVTNYHVIEGSQNLTVVFSYDEDNAEPSAVEAHVKGYDQDKDSAVIAISADDLTKDMTSQLSIATIGSSNDLARGEQVVAIGNALGYGQSVTTGIVKVL